MQINKSDRNDAVGLARIMEAGWYKEVQVKSLPCHEIRAVLNSRAQLVKIKRDLENQIRGLLKNLGLRIGKAGGNIFRRRAEELVGEHRLLQEAVRPLLAVREIVRREIASLTRKLLALARDNDESRRSLTVPGIGPITALAFCAAIDEPSRFQRSHKRWRLLRADAAPPCLGRGRLDWPDLQMRRCHGQDIPLRGRRRAAHPRGPLVPAQSLGAQAGQTDRLQEGQGRRGPKTCGHPASHVARSNRLHLVNQGGCSLDNQDPGIPLRRNRCPCRDGGVGEIDLGFAMLHRGKRDSHIDPPASSNAIMQRAHTKLR